MDQPMRDFTDLLLTRGIIALEQLSEAKGISKKEDTSIGQCLVKLGYATGEEVTQALAEFYKFEYVDLSAIRIPDHVIQLVPESVARENKIIPISDEDETIKVLVSDPFDIETIEKLRFILNRKVETALAPQEHIQEAINKYYRMMHLPVQARRGSYIPIGEDAQQLQNQFHMVNGRRGSTRELDQVYVW